jgi:serine/threonine protein kinase
MTEKPTCPDRLRLESLLAGLLSEAEQGAVTEHVEGCESCQKTLDILAGNSREEQARRLADPPTTLDPALEQVMHDALSGETQAAEARTGGDESLAFLDPPREPGHLGRLKHYEVLELVGQGGFGLVFKAFDEKLQRVVAIKVLAPALAASATARKRFVREAQAAAAIRNEHVVAIYQVNDEHSPPYLVMEFIAGLSLQDRLDRDGPLEVREALRIGLQAAEGLAAAHKQGLVHRDIKPANILLENGVQRVKITDFGLARAADDASLSQSGVIAGTPMYMSPEQAQGEALDHRSDLFSLGSVLYVMCTGRPPFRASTTLAVLKRVCEELSRPIRESNPEVPEWLCAVIEKLQAKKATDRFGSARELADLLQCYLAHLQQPGRDLPPLPHVGPSPTVAPPPRRRGWRVLTASVLLPVLMVATSLMWKAYHPHGNAPPPDDPGPRPNQTPPLAIAPFDEQQARQYQEAWARHLGVDVEITNSIGMKLLLIPPGEFLMGSTEEEVNSALKADVNSVESDIRSELPQRSKRIKEAFYLGSCEVTVGQFRNFVKETKHRTRAELNGKGGMEWDIDAMEFRANPANVWHNNKYSASEEHPVLVMAPSDIQVFCDWLSAKEGVRYVIPEEEQWEYACRAGTSGHWCSGDDPKEAAKFGWFLPDSGWVSHPVRMKLPNAFGLFDMHGNAGEYARATQRQWSMRGGRSVWYPWFARSASRELLRGNDPWRSHPEENIYVWRGFRVAMVGDLKPNASPAAAFPFAVLARDASAERKFTTLAKAVAAAQAGDTIEVRGDGPFRSDRIQINKPLRIRAATGSCPVIAFEHDPIDWWHSVIDVAAPLAVEGIEFRYQRPPTGGVVQLFCVTSELRMAHCRVVAQGQTAGIWLPRGRVEIDRSLILASNWWAFHYSFEGAAQLTVTNSVLVGLYAIVTLHSCDKRDENPDFTVRLRRSTARSPDQVVMWLVDEGTPALKKGDKPVRWHVVESVFSMQRLVNMGCRATDYQETAPVRALLQGTVAWSEDRNVYPTQPLIELNVRPDETTWRRLPGGDLCSSLDEWSRFWEIPPTKSIQATIEFAGAKVVDNFVADIHKITAADFRLVKGSPGQGVLPGGKDLGADVDRVGPGKPYEEWKKTDEYKEWQKKTDELIKAR